MTSVKTAPVTIPDLDVEASLAFVEKSQQLAGHFPSEEDMRRARAVLTGELAVDEAIAELDAKYRVQ